nr:C-Myc-binding protein [Pelodiscus sinensis]|eukprot:XP_006134336.1 C-Myc-binding protein [Pelodiscus sinensis]
MAVFGSKYKLSIIFNVILSAPGDEHNVMKPNVVLIELFRKFLLSSVGCFLLTVLVALYEEPEKPNSALDFLKHHIGAAAPENPEIEALRLEVAEMKEKYEAVLEENKKLKSKLSQYEPPPEEKRGE